MLYRSELGVDVSGKLLTVEQVLVEHGQGDGVRARVALAHCRGIIPVDVIDRDVRQSGEGVEDHALAAVGELEVIASVRESGVHSELEPVLELSVEVRAH